MIGPKHTKTLSNTASLQLYYPDAECEKRAELNLSELLAAAVKQHCPPLMIVRIEKMPCIRGSKTDLQQAFAALIKIIVAYPPAAGRHYLHLKCMEHPMLETGQQPCKRIAFHSNIDACANLPQKEQKTLAQAKALLSASRIHLECCSGNNGCLYLLTLPGNSTT